MISFKYMSSTLKDAWLCVKESEGPRVAGKTEENLKFDLPQSQSDE